MNLKKTILKLIVFIIFIACVLVLVKTISPKNENNHFQSIINTLQDNINTPSYYFIGSSRLQRSVNPKTLITHFNTDNIHNLSISGSTFLGNCIIADFILKQQNSKVVFIELSPIIPELPENLIQFCDQAEINVFETIHSLTEQESFQKKTMFKLNILNHYLFSKISIKKDLKRILNTDPKKDKKMMGFVTAEANNYNSSRPFITYEEIEYWKGANQKIYTNYINHILDLGKKNNSKIVFILPVTFRSEKEKAIVIPLYNSLPDHMKVKYSKEFIKSITDSKYLLDEIHFNSLGSEKYSTLLLPLLKEHLP